MGPSPDFLKKMFKIVRKNSKYYQTPGMCYGNGVELSSFVNGEAPTMAVCSRTCTDGNISS